MFLLLPHHKDYYLLIEYLININSSNYSKIIVTFLYQKCGPKDVKDVTVSNGNIVKSNMQICMFS